MSCETCEATIVEMIDLSARLRAAEIEIERVRPVVLAAVKFFQVKLRAQSAFINDRAALGDLRSAGAGILAKAKVFEAHAERLSVQITGALDELERAVMTAAVTKALGHQ